MSINVMLATISSNLTLETVSSNLTLETMSSNLTLETVSNNMTLETMAIAGPFQTADKFLVFRCFVISISIIGAAGNFVMILILHLSKSQIASRDSKILILNQLLLDLLTCVVVILTYSLKVAEFWYPSDSTGYWIFCVLVESEALLYIFLTNSIISLVAIAVERYLKIVHWLYRREAYKSWMTKLAIVFTWLLFPSVNLLPTFISTRVIGGQCITLAFWPMWWMGKVYVLVLVLVFFVLPFAIVLYCYLRIGHVLRGRSRIIPGKMTGSDKTWLQTGAFKKQVSVLKTMVILVVCSAILWVPSKIYFVLTSLINLPYSDSGRYFTVFLSLLNTCINLFIYAVKMEDVKGHLLKLIVCSGRRQNESGCKEVIVDTIPTIK